MFKLYINGEIKLNDTNPSIMNKLNLYYFNFDGQTTSNDTQAETETETETQTTKSKKNKISKNTNSIYQRIRPLLSSSYHDKIELFTPLIANNINFDKIQSFLDNSLVLKYQKYLILVYITQIFINLFLLYVPIFV